MNLCITSVSLFFVIEIAENCDVNIMSSFALRLHLLAPRAPEDQQGIAPAITVTEDNSTPVDDDDFVEYYGLQAYVEGIICLVEISSLHFVVPQGSVFFLLYTAELLAVITCSRLSSQSFADDTQVYISAPVATTLTSVQLFVEGIERVDASMSRNRLK